MLSSWPPARVEPRVAAALDDSISGSEGSEGSERWNSRSIIWAYKTNGFGSLGQENDHPDSKIFDLFWFFYVDGCTSMFCLNFDGWTCIV